MSNVGRVGSADEKANGPLRDEGVAIRVGREALEKASDALPDISVRSAVRAEAVEGLIHRVSLKSKSLVQRVKRPGPGQGP